MSQEEHSVTYSIEEPDVEPNREPERDEGFKPVMKLQQSPQKKELNPQLCLICQKEQGDLVDCSKVTGESLQVIVSQCREHEDYNTGKYFKLQGMLKNKSGLHLKSLGFSYHYNCRKDFIKDKIFITRAKCHLEKQKKGQKRKTDRLSRSSVAEIFNKEHCLFCQKEITEVLYSLTEDAPDEELRKAFDECPVSLELYRIRYEGAFDSFAKEIKYHRTCWIQHITRRVPLVKPKRIKLSSTSKPNNVSEIRSNRIQSTNNTSLDFQFNLPLEPSINLSLESPVSASFNAQIEETFISPVDLHIESGGSAIRTQDPLTSTKIPRLRKRKLSKITTSSKPSPNSESSNEISRSIESTTGSICSQLASPSGTSSSVIMTETPRLRKLSSGDRNKRVHELQDAHNEIDKETQISIFSDITTLVAEALVNKKVLSLKDIVEVYKQRLNQLDLVDSRNYKAISKRVKYFLQKELPDIQFEQVQYNEPQRIKTQNMDSLIMYLAEQKKAEETKDYQTGILKKAAEILRKESLDCIKKNRSDFQGSVLNDDSDCPKLLSQFFKWTLAGKHELNKSLDDQVDQLSRTSSYNVLYNIKSDRQALFQTPDGSSYQSRHRYFPKHHIGMSLSLRRLDRNNLMLNLLSAPNYGLAMPSRQTLRYETIIANSVIDNIEANDNAYIPPGLQKNQIPLFHLDNIDFNEDTPDGKHTSHLLQLSIFQRKLEDRTPFKLDLDMKTASLTLKPNKFDELVQCRKPSKSNFQRTPGCTNFSRANITSTKSKTIKPWLTLKTLEYTFQKSENQRWKSLVESVTEENIAESQQELLDSLMISFDELVVPSYSASCSVTCNDIDTTLTNIYSTPLIPGPASDYSAILTALLQAHKVTQWCCGETGKTVLTLDLDLYEKVYLLVNSRDDLRKKYILCLGELHAVFAHIRAIGSFISCSGIDDAWLDAKWFDSSCVVRQVVECSHMKRAVEAHEATLITINIFLLRSLMSEYPEDFSMKGSDMLTLINMAHFALKEEDNAKLRKAFKYLESELENLDIEKKESEMSERRKENQMYQFIMIYRRMVMRLLAFIEASRSRNWLMHLSAAEEMMKDLVSMDRVKYRRMWAAYIADMRRLEEDDPDVWRLFMSGEFSVQKTDGYFTAIGRDHAGEQVNKDLKTKGGLVGISSNENSRTKHILISPVVEEICNEMTSMGGATTSGTNKHHQFSTAYTNRQNVKVASLCNILEKHGLHIDKADATPITNVVTGQVFSEEICRDILRSEEVGEELYEVFVKERLQEDSKVGLFDPLKKANLKTFKSSNKKKTIKIRDRIVELKENCNLFAKCAILKESRAIDMEKVVGDHELTVVPRSLMEPCGKLLDGGQGKSALIKTTLKYASCPKLHAVDSIDCFAIDGMVLLHEMAPKPNWIKTGADLAKEFCSRVDNITANALVVIIAFDRYIEHSLKKLTRAGRQKAQLKSIPRHYEVGPDTNIANKSMKELLAHDKTKTSLTKLLTDSVANHLKGRQINFAVANLLKTQYDFSVGNQGIIENNHEEADTLLIHCLSLAPIEDLNTVVYCSDTDVFVLLLKHHSAINSTHLYMQTSSAEYIDISAVWEYLGQEKANALLSLHAVTGCDTAGKFNGKSKEFWTKIFFESLDDENLIAALNRFQANGPSDDAIDELAQFISLGYLWKKKKSVKKRITQLNNCRYYLFSKDRCECHFLPPTLGAFRYHVLRAYHQLHIWSLANIALIPILDPTEYGWEMKDDEFVPLTTDDLIAPVSVIELVSCVSCSKCTKNSCICKRSNEACTDFCGCGDECENVDYLGPRFLDADDDIE